MDIILSANIISARPWMKLQSQLLGIYGDDLKSLLATHAFTQGPHKQDLADLIR